MNYTITFSPSIDYVIDNQINKFVKNNLTRVENYYLLPGGKGLNATYIMNELNVKNTAITFTYGKTEKLFLDLLKDYGIKNYEAINLKSDLDIRINVKYFDKENNFEINGPSPKINKKEIDELKDKLKKLKENDIVFIMGKCDETILIDLIKFIKSKNAEFVIDIDSKILISILPYNPLLIKPNIDELKAILDKPKMLEKDVIKAMTDLKSNGAKNIIVSMGGNGSILLDENNDYYKISFNPLSNVKSTVGCGDTLLSSFASFKYNLNLDSLSSIKKATALSMSTASNWFLGKFDDIKKFEKEVVIQKY